MHARNCPKHTKDFIIHAFYAWPGIIRELANLSIILDAHENFTSIIIAIAKDT